MRKFSPDDQRKLREILEKLIVNDKKWFDEQAIFVGCKNNNSHWILNYRHFNKNEYNRLVRGMVVRNPGSADYSDPLELIQSFPFVRFFNQNEKDAANIDFNNAEMLEKLDGTMVVTSLCNGEPQWNTRQMFSLDDVDMNRNLTNFYGKRYKFMPTIGNFVKKLNFSPIDGEYTYVFEFIHDASYVLTKYKPEQYGLYLIGARRMSTFDELTEDELDLIAERIVAQRPKRWNAVSDENEIQKLMEKMNETTPDFEGFVFRDKTTGERIKVKDANYLVKHHAITDTMSVKNFLPIILKGEEAEFLAYLPHVADFANKIKQKYNDYLEGSVAEVVKWNNTGLSGKGLADAIFGVKGDHNFVSPIKDNYKRYFVLKAVKKNITDEGEIRSFVDEQLKNIGLGFGTNGPSPKLLMNVIGLDSSDNLVGFE